MIVNNLCKTFGKSFYSSSLLIFGWTGELSTRKERLFYFHPLIRGRITLKLLEKIQMLFWAWKIIPLSLLTCKISKLYQPVLLKTVFIPACLYVRTQSPIYFQTPFREIFLCSIPKAATVIKCLLFIAFATFCCSDLIILVKLRTAL